jgi:hypothetical protein
MTSAEEQQLLASLAEGSRDIKSHLILIGELAARRVEVDTRAGRSPAQIAPNPKLTGIS